MVVGGFQRGLPRYYVVLCRPEINRIISLTERFHPLLSRVRFEMTIRCQSAKLVTAQVLFTRDVNPWPEDSWVRIPPSALLNKSPVVPEHRGRDRLLRSLDEKAGL